LEASIRSVINKTVVVMEIISADFDMGRRWYLLRIFFNRKFKKYNIVNNNTP
jgi:hypothetical protein